MSVLLDMLWPVAQREGLKSKDDLTKLDLRTVEISANGRLIVPPLLFSQERAKHPSLFKRATEMSPSERQEFVRATKANAAARAEAAKAPRDHIPHPRHSNPHAPANKNSARF